MLIVNIKLKLITIEDLIEMMENNETFKLVEVLPKADYDKGHIHGAINIPVDQIDELAPKLLKKTDKIVTYCAGYDCHASSMGTRALMRLGYKNVVDFKAGKKGWIKAELKLEK